MWWMMILLVTLGLTAIISVALIYGSRRWESATKEMHAKLEAARLPIGRKTYGADELIGLPASTTTNRLVVQVDQEIQCQLGSLETATTAEPAVPKRTKASAYQRRRYEPKTFDLRGELYRIFGVDLTNVPGISAITAQTILCEIGTDVSRFRNASAFASWLGLCPEKKVSGGKVLYSKSRRVRSRVATALRMGAHSLHHAKDYLGEFFRRITRKLGKPQAVTATAHKLARIIFHLLSTREAYDESVFHKCEEETRKRAELRLRRNAAHLGFQVIPATNG